ncbi:MAG: dethiobiotin synthase [Thermoleophilaceae bacterium]|nr:dethiobiotin synthase [Thermoleophilaceae bacterium]
MAGLFITGTGTGVGKSVVAAAIISALTARGRRVAAFKPAVSGLDEPTPGWPIDHELLAGATGWQTPEQVSPFTFGPAVSPHLAASLAGTAITLDALLAAYEASSADAELTICEGVGGLLVPLSDAPPLSVLDLARSLDLPLVVATHPGLGTISDTRLTVDRIHAEGLKVAAVVVSGWPDQPSKVELSNLETLARLLRVEVATLPMTTPDRLAQDASSLPIERWISTA